jgi:hypothetical protein
MRISLGILTLALLPALLRAAEGANAVTESSGASTNVVSTNMVATAAATNDVPEATGFAAFKIIAERNIFDPNRQQPGVKRSDEETPKPVRIDFITLVGSMSYEKGDFAFFDGTQSEYRKSVKLGDSIAGYKLAHVGHDKVTLENDGKNLEMPVGGQLKRLDEGEWKLSDQAESYTSAASASSSTSGRGERKDRNSASEKSSATTSPAKSSSDEGPSDALKRLLERRKQEK